MQLILLGLLKATFKGFMMSLMTENMLRWLIIWGMEKLVAKTENKWDDELFQRMKKELEK